VLVHLGGHEGRAIGLSAKIAAYALQDGGADTVDANLELGLPVDAREYGGAAAVLRALGVERVRLLTNNPAKELGLSQHGVEVVERVG
ncbi:bifunctional 3,4-dihydroxy-2-butanone-4-phosphate synthase/GTP cyclohydrolase II, partial [Streptomyces sp. NP160]